MSFIASTCTALPRALVFWPGRGMRRAAITGDVSVRPHPLDISSPMAS